MTLGRGGRGDIPSGLGTTGELSGVRTTHPGPGVCVNRLVIVSSAPSFRFSSLVVVGD